MLLPRAPLLALAVVPACSGGDSAPAHRMAGGPKPDELPVMVNAEPPFRYPPVLYARRVQGNVLLRLYIDRDGRPRPESTQVAESSGHPELDSAAVRGSESLRFVPARSDGEPHGAAVLFPVLFRHPDAPPLPGDTALPRRQPS
jgi:periplasmic protein TonB